MSSGRGGTRRGLALRQAEAKERRRQSQHVKAPDHAERLREQGMSQDGDSRPEPDRRGHDEGRDVVPRQGRHGGAEPLRRADRREERVTRTRAEREREQEDRSREDGVRTVRR